jgi:single-stranded DNA-binding protein
MEDAQMSVAILVSGSIFKEPTQRIGKSGRPYTTCTIKAAAADNASSDFWSVLAFGDTAGAELMRLAVGERCSIQGALKFELYTASDGQKKISKTIFCDHVMPLRQPPKERKSKPPAAGSKAADAIVKQSILQPDDLNDDVPF